MKKDTTILENQDISVAERQLFSYRDHSTSCFYKVLKDCGSLNTGFLKETWERTLDTQITDDQWKEAWKNAISLSVCNRVKAMQLKILHRAHISPSRRHKFEEELSPICLKCKTEEGDLVHCFWLCREIQKFCAVIEQEISGILYFNIGCDPKHMLLGIFDEINMDKHKKNTLQVSDILCKKMYSPELDNGQNSYKVFKAQGNT